MMDNPFAKFGITHLSPSSCNAYTTAPAMWVMERLLKRECGVGLPAHAGSAAEAGIVAGLVDPDRTIESCREIAMKKFLTLSKFINDDERKKKYVASLPHMVSKGIEELRPFGLPSATQGEVSYSAEGLAVPFKGYYDFIWEQHGLIIDLKTSLTMPSEIKVGHARQVSLYKHAVSDNYKAMITTVTASRVTTREVENTRQHLDALVKIGIAIQELLSISDDPHKIAAILVPDYDHFFWNNPTARSHAFQVWGY